MENNLDHIIDKNNGFKTPPSYFDDLENQITERVKLEDRSLKKAPFLIPDDYFSKLEAKIAEKTRLDGPGETKVIPFQPNRFVKYAVAIAAILLLILTVYNFQDDQGYIFENSITSIVNYIESDDINLSTHDLQELLSDEILENDFLGSNISREDLLEYLSYTIDDTTFFDE